LANFKGLRGRPRDLDSRRTPISAFAVPGYITRWEGFWKPRDKAWLIGIAAISRTITATTNGK